MNGNPLIYFIVMIALGLMVFAGINIQAENQVHFDESGTINGTDTEMPDLQEYQEQQETWSGIEMKIMWAVMIIFIIFMVLAAFHFLFGRRIF